MVSSDRLWTEGFLKNKRGGDKLELGLDDIRKSYVSVVGDSEAKYMVEEIEARLSVCDFIEKVSMILCRK